MEKIKTIANHHAVKPFIDKWASGNRDCEIKLTASGFVATQTDAVSGYPDEVLTVRFKAGKPPVISGKLRHTFVLTDSEKDLIANALAADQHTFAKPFLVRKDSVPLPDKVEMAIEDSSAVVHFIPNEVLYSSIEVISRKDDGTKIPVLYTFFGHDDGQGEWRTDHPDELTLWGNGKDSNTVFVFEGINTAKAVHKLVYPATKEEQEAADAHPWAEWLKAGDPAIAGFYAGVNAVGRFNWSELDNAAKTVYIFADNDLVGKQAAGEIARFLPKATVRRIEFDGRFPVGWDLADPMPKNDKVNDLNQYVIRFGGWCTKFAGTDDKGKRLYALTAQAERELCYIAGSDRFAVVDEPTARFDAASFNRKFAHATDYANVAELVTKSFAAKRDTIGYRPGADQSYVANGGRVLNLWRPSTIKAVAGDVSPWLQFIEHLIPDQAERHQLKRWFATVAAKPDQRVIYAPLLVSKQTGTGKSTFARILAELVGNHNSSAPDQQLIEGAFNSWLFAKRLIVCNEIYGNRATFCKLKDKITEPVIEINEKHEKSASLENRAAFILCSNSLQALYVEPNDRRIFAPRVNEKLLPAAFWSEFNRWLDKDNGLGKILQWAMDYGDYVQVGERAPDSSRKSEMISETMPEAERKLRDAIELLPKGIIGAQDVVDQLRSVTERSYLKQSDVRVILAEAGWHDPAIDSDMQDYAKDWRNPLKPAAGRQFPLIHPDLREIVLADLESKSVTAAFCDLYQSLDQQAFRM